MKPWITPPNLRRANMVRPSKPKLIVLDGDVELLSSIADIARVYYQVIRTSDSRWAIAWLAQYRDVAAILVQDDLPGMSGLRLLHDARVMRPDVLRVLASREIDHPMIVQGLMRGTVDRLVEKPMSKESLLAAIAPVYSEADATPLLSA